MAFLCFAILTAAAIAEPIPTTKKTFSSTLHGFSFEYPAAWIKDGPTFCGNELMGLTKDDRDRRLWPVVIFHSERSTEQMQLRPAIYVWYQAIRSDGERAIDEKLPEEIGTAKYSSKSSRITTHEGLVGYKFVDQATPGNASPVASIRYWFPHHGRLLFVTGLDGGRGLDELEPIFDAVASSVKMTAPFSETPAGQPKMFKKSCASVTYPGDWSQTVWSFDDNKEGYRFEAPRFGKEETGTIQLLFDDKSLAQYEEESRASLSKNAHWFEVKPFENSKGQKGLKVAAEIGFGKTNKTTWFVLPCSNERLAVLFCWDHNNDDIDWDPVFAHSRIIRC